LSKTVAKMVIGKALGKADTTSELQNLPLTTPILITFRREKGSTT